MHLHFHMSGQKFVQIMGAHEADAPFLASFRRQSPTSNSADEEYQGVAERAF